MISVSTTKTAQALLDWDLLRVAELANAGHDVTVYQARQRAVQNAIAAALPPASWPRECLDVLQALLEVSMTAQHVMQAGVGVLAKTPPRLLPAALKALAIELGVVESLRAVAPRHWAEEAR